MEWAQRVPHQTMVTATATNEMERDSYFSIIVFLRAADAAQAAAAADRHFSHLSFVLHLVRNEVFDTFFVPFLPESSRLCLFGGWMDSTFVFVRNSA